MSEALKQELYTPDVAAVASHAAEAPAQADGAMRQPLLLLRLVRRRLVTAIPVLAIVIVGGFFIDLWAHSHGRVDESFFTPWHGMLYAAAGQPALSDALLTPTPLEEPYEPHCANQD